MNLSPVARLKKTWSKVKTAKFDVLEVLAPDPSLISGLSRGSSAAGGGIFPVAHTRGTSLGGSGFLSSPLALLPWVGSAPRVSPGE